MDGKTTNRSLTPLLFASSDEAVSAVDWREDFLFEFWAGQNPVPTPGAYCHHTIMVGNNTYQGVRTANGTKFVEFDDSVNFTEFYDLATDPHEITNRAHDPDAADTVKALQNRLSELRFCKLSLIHI